MPDPYYFDVPSYLGTFLPASSRPDTLSLPDRADLALNGMLGTIDPELLTMWGLVHYAARKPHLSHWASAETLVDPKLAESLTLMRVMSGSRHALEMEMRYRAAILSRMQDGLYWDRCDPRRPWRNSYAGNFYGAGRDEDFCTLPGAARLMRCMLIWRELGAEPEAMERGLRELTDGLLRIAVKKGDYAYYPERGGWGEPGAYPRSGWLNTDEAKGETEGGEGSVVCIHGHQIYAAARWWALSGQGQALDLARLLTRYVMLPRFWGGVPDPYGDRAITQLMHIGAHKPGPAYTTGSELGHWYSHFHARAIALRGILEYAWAAGDERAAEFVRRSYEFTLTQGIARMGWFNTYPAGFDHVEGCALGDMVALGARLSDYGLGDYWDDVDAVVRNQLVEQQLTRADLLERVSRHSSGQCCEGTPPGQIFAPEDIFERTLGVYAGTSLPTGVPAPWVMHCCTANATQGLYYAWEGTLRERGTTAEVNLFLNRAGKLAEVQSDLPHAGRVRVLNRAARMLAVRIPAWVRRDGLRVRLNDQDNSTAYSWVGNRLVFAALAAGDTVALDFPVETRTFTYTANAASPNEQEYTLQARGSTVVDISPREEDPTTYPLYLRDSLKTAETPFKETRAFVPDQVVTGW